MIAAVLEYWVEALVFGTLHEATPLFWLGLSLCVAGQALRWVAFVHAGHSFTHMIEERKSEKHVLVTDGIYRYIRHPGMCTRVVVKLPPLLTRVATTQAMRDGFIGVSARSCCCRTPSAWSGSPLRRGGERERRMHVVLR